MKTIILSCITMLYCASVSAQVEDQPVSQKQFKAAMAKDKARRRPANILPARTYISNQKTYAEKTFHVKVIGDGIVGLDAIGGGACGFHYVASGDEGFADAGSGTYYMTSKSKKVCGDLWDIKGQDVSSVDLVVQYKRPVESVSKSGAVIRAAGFKILKRH